MDVVEFGKIFNFQSKSKVKAGEGLAKGEFPFFTSSNTLSKFINESGFSSESLIFGTGGQASIHYCNEKFNVSTDCLVAQAKNEKEVFSKFVFYFLSGNIHLLEKEFKGAGLKHISKGAIQNILIPLPPLPEQKRIAQILDKADALRQKNKQLLAAYHELLQATFLDMFGDPVNNPKGWAKKKLGRFGNWRSGGTPLRSKKEYYEGEIPWLSSGELNNMYVSNSNEHITELAINESAASIVEIGSLLLGMYDTAALKSSINKVILTCNQAIAFAKLDDKKINTIFAYTQIQLGKEYFKSKQRGVRQKNLNLSMIKALQLLYPPIEQQNQFAQIVENIEVQKAILKQSILQSENLFNGLVQKAFKGEL